MKSERTPWFPRPQQPVHVGRYETRFQHEDGLIEELLWDGETWFYDDQYGTHDAVRATFDSFEWRGLA